MSTEAPDVDSPSSKEIADTWRWKQDGASWVASVSFSTGDAPTVNRLVANAAAGLFDDFAPLARVRTAMLLAEGGPTHLMRQPGERCIAFHARVLDGIAAHALPLLAVELGLDVRIWMCTTESPNRPELAWLSYPGIELGLHLTDTAWVEFELDNTLFSAFTYPDMDPNPLHPLNQPLLEGALRRMRARFAEPLQLYGELPGRIEFGFSSDRDDY